MENSKAIKQIEQTDRWLRIMTVLTSFILIGLALITLLKVISIYSQLEKEVAQRSNQTQTIVKEIQTENEASHGELLKFVRCILQIPANQRTQVDIDRCTAETNIPVSDFTQPSQQGTTSNTTPVASPIPSQSPKPSPSSPPSSVIRPTTPPSPNPISDPFGFIMNVLKGITP